MNIKNKIFIFINDLYKVNARTNIFYGLSRNDDSPLGNYVVKYIIFHEKELNHYLTVGLYHGDLQSRLPQKP